MSQGRIRVIALAIVLNRGRLLVFRAQSYVKGSFVYRPLGGGIEHGERGVDTVVREMKEETGADLIDVRYLETLENIFIHNGEMGHEIVLLYGGRLANQALYDQDEIDVVEGDGTRLTGMWISLAECESGALRLVPEGLLEFLKRNGLPDASTA